MPLTSSPQAPAVAAAQSLSDLVALFPTGALAPFRPELRLASLEMSALFAVHAPQIGGLRRSEMLLAAEFSRWRAMLMHDDAIVAWASLRPDDAASRLGIVEVNVSLWIDRVVAGIELAEADPRVAGANYELRFIESRAHRFFGLWLVPESRGDEELVIPISDHRWSLQSGAIYDLRTVSTTLAETEDDSGCATF